jgi:NosR/NirI family nitrous oxide reductase transcriptional regulator
MSRIHRILWLAALLVWAGGYAVAHADVMTRETMVKAFPSPLIVGEKDHDLPVWPIFKKDATSTPIVAYAFESIDLAPIPGFSGTPFNLLVALDKDGKFMDVKVLSQHEPVFLDGLGEAPLFKFVEQYAHLSLTQSIKIGLNQSASSKSSSANVYIDGVAKATASVRILNQSLLASSLKVARAKMGYTEGNDPDLIARIRPDVYEPMDWNALLKAGLVARKVFKNFELESAFRGTLAEGVDTEVTVSPNTPFVALYFAHLNVPSVGRNLLPAKTWAYVQSRLEPGDHALLVMSTGRYSIVSDDFQRGTVPDRLTLKQRKLPLELRDLDLDTSLNIPPELADAQWRVFRVIAPAGLDPSQTLDFELLVTRSKGQILSEIVRTSLGFSAQLPDRYYEAAGSDSKTWHVSWTSRWRELAILFSGLGVLAWALGNPKWLSASQRRLNYFRTGYLLFTLFFIGWYAQGQLSIVNFTAVIQALFAHRSLSFFLYDPMTVSLWVFVAITFFIWGRGTFCGWLCPFGALQELISKVTQRLHLKPVQVSVRLDRILKRLKFMVLGVLLISACLSVTWTDRLVEVEPFKTSITLNFVREWPFVLWAFATVFGSSFFYKGYCRYLCPLGAGMSVLGRLRRFDWIDRRTECGQPCQRCRSDCTYQAIHKDGQVDYDECFQCMDCVVIYESETLCVPVYNASRKAGGKSVIPIVAMASGGAPT